MSGGRFEDDVRIAIRDYYSLLQSDDTVDAAFTRLDSILNDDDGNPVDGGRWLSSEQVAQVRELRAVAERKRSDCDAIDASALAIPWAGRVLALDDVLALLDAPKEEK